MLNLKALFNYFNMLFGMHAVKHLCLYRQLDFTQKRNGYENN